MTQDRTPATVGLIGGMSWESTALYYRLLNEGAAARLGGLHSLECIVYSVDFAEIEELQASGRWEREGLVATAFTMEQSFSRSRLEVHGIEVCVPGDTGRAAIHRIIYDELCRGVIRAESRQVLQRLIDGLVDDGAQGVILGCTEVELLISAADSPVQVFPTTQLHVQAALEHALPRGGQE